MPLSLADGRRRLYVFPERPEDITAITLPEFLAAKVASKSILAQGFQFGPQDSATFAEKPLEIEGEVQSLGASNAIVQGTMFRYYGVTGIPDPTDDWFFEQHKDRGSTVFAALVDRALAKTADLIAGEHYQYVEYLTDTPKPQQEMTGWMKNDFRGLPQEWHFHGLVTAATGG